jgi:hypothetical protein
MTKAPTHQDITAINFNSLNIIVLENLKEEAIFFSFLVFQGLPLARQMLYHLIHAPTSSCFSYFSGKILFLSRPA